MNRFNLTFSGEILPGYEAELVKLHFANMFDIDDPAHLKKLFNGGTFILRRNLERKDAAQYYHDLQQLGVRATLVKVTASDLADDIVNASPSKKSVPDKTTAFIRHVPATAMQKTRAAAEALEKNNPATWHTKSGDAAAEIKSRKLAAQRLAAQKAAHEKAALEKQQRKNAEEAALEKELAIARLRAAEQERARKEAEQARLAAEETAIREAERAKIQRLEAEEVTRKTALKAQTKRKAAEEAAQRKARRDQQKAEKAQRKSQEEARRKAKLEEQKRIAAEDKARRKAELEERKKIAAEQEARLKVELEERKGIAAAEEARLEAELDEQRRLAAKKKVRREAEMTIAPSAAVKAQQQPTAGSRPTQRKPGKTRVKTTVETPLRKQADQATEPLCRKRMPGEPNLYTLKPFRNSESVRLRASVASRRMRQGYRLAILALAVLLILGGSFLQNNHYPVVTGARAIAINSNFEPLLLAGDALFFHDRAGVSTATATLSEWGLDALEPPVVFGTKETLFALGQLTGNSADKKQSSALQLLRCNITTSSCEQFSAQLAGSYVNAFAINPLDGSLLVADSAAGELLKVNNAGRVIVRAAVTLPQQPVLRMQGGLLLMNSADGPAISVFRYEDETFGTQLDEILLLPTSAETLEKYRVIDFIWSGEAWWVNLVEPDSGRSAIHRFDQDWNHLGAVNVRDKSGPLQLLKWAQKTLANDPLDPIIQRYNSDGEAEVPFTSKQLQAFITRQQQDASFAASAWQLVLLLCVFTVLAGFGYGYLQSARSLVYKRRREQGAAPLDNYASQLQWVDPIKERHSQLQKTGLYYGLAAVTAVIFAIALSVTVWQLAALLLVISGPAAALLLISRQPVGAIGTLKDKLLLVDHRGMYHLASGSKLQYRSAFIAIDDVIIFTGTPLLPAFCAAQIAQQVTPLALGGIKVDPKTIVVKLLQCHHPLALGSAAILATLAGAALLLLLQAMF